MSKEFIRIGGAREHNLKNLTLQIPRDQLVARDLKREIFQIMFPGAANANEFLAHSCDFLNLINLQTYAMWRRKQSRMLKKWTGQRASMRCRRF